jgi:hypothetical protein
VNTQLDPAVLGTTCLGIVRGHRDARPHAFHGDSIRLNCAPLAEIRSDRGGARLRKMHVEVESTDIVRVTRQHDILGWILLQIPGDRIESRPGLRFERRRVEVE